MSQTVSAHQQSAFTDPQNGQSPIDAGQVTANDNALRIAYIAHDADSGIHFQSSVLGSRPAAGTAGRKWLATDTLAIHFDTGAAWVEIDYLNKTNGGTVAGAVTFSGGITGALTGNVTGNVTGNASTATALQTARDITLSGDVTGTVSFNGTATASMTTAIGAGVIVNADINAAAAIAYSKLALTGSILNADLAGSIASTKLLTVGVAQGGTGNTGTPTNGQLLIGNGSGFTLATLTAGANCTITNSAGGITISVSGTIGTEPSNGDKGDITVSAAGLTWTIDNGVITNAKVSASAAIAYSKLNLTGAILDADLAGSIGYGKLALTGQILDADLAGSISAAKLAGSIPDTKLDTIATASKVSNSATTATSANTPSAIVARDSNGDFSARQVTVSGLYRSGNQVVGSRVTGYAPTWTGVTANRSAIMSNATLSAPPAGLSDAAQSANLIELASFVQAMYNDLITHGLIGT